MPADANCVVQALVTKTSTFSSTAFDLGSQNFGVYHGLYARFRYANANNASGANSVTFSIDTCSTSGGTYTVGGAGTAAPLALSTTNQAGEVFIPITGQPEFIKATATIAGGGSTPTVDYQCELVPAKP